MSSILKGLMREGGKRTVKGVADEIASYIGDHPSDSAIVDAVEHEAELNDLDPSELFDAVYDHFRDHIDENLHKWFKEKWVRFGPDGKVRGDCARGSDSEGKPKCLPQSKAHNLGKKGRASAASRKRREDPNPDRHGPAHNVATKKKTNEEQMDENCWKGYHKEGNKKMFGKTVPNCVKNEDIQEAQKCPECGGAMYHESMLNEKQDACYRKVKSRYKVWPSAYASGALVQCRKKGAANWGNKSESVEEAANAAQQAAIAINMKKHHKKPKHVDEDYTGIESGPSTGPFTAEKTPAINPYGGMKDRKYRGAIGEGISEGEVVPFRRKELTWKDIPGDVKSLLNDLFWAEMETGSYAGTTNKKYRKQLDDEIDEFISEMQNRGWRFHRDWDKNVIELTNTKGQTVTLPDTIEFFTDEFEDDLTEMPDTSGPVGVQPGGWRTYKIKPAGTHMKRESSILKGLIREEESLKSNNPVGIPEDEEMDEDTSYAGGMGQGGYAGQSYRKFKPKMAGTHMKRESSILKGLMREEELEEVSSTGQGGGSAGIGGGSMVGGPTTYEQEYNMFKRKGPRRITAMTTEMKNVPPKRSR